MAVKEHAAATSGELIIAVGSFAAGTDVISQICGAKCHSSKAASPDEIAG
jgi:hypothetical protein